MNTLSVVMPFSFFIFDNKPTGTSVPSLINKQERFFQFPFLLILLLVTVLYSKIPSHFSKLSISPVNICIMTYRISLETTFTVKRSQ